MHQKNESERAMESCREHGLVIQLFVILFLSVDYGLKATKEDDNLVNFDECKCSSVLEQHVCESIEGARFEGSFVFGCGQAIDRASRDFGGIYTNKPVGVLNPASIQDISKIIKLAGSTTYLTVSAYGNGHSLGGQAQAFGGIVVNMTCLKGIHVVNSDGEEGFPYVDASGGELWSDVLNATLAKGLSSRSFTDYLHLTVGGTLSNAGISGQTHRFGPQINNVLQLQVVTGRGDVITCSKTNNPDLFNAVLGGLGQFGIITQARIVLQPAKYMARRVRIVYNDVTSFMQDIEEIVHRDQENGFDYVEGLVFSNTPNTANGWPAISLTTNQAFDASLIPSTTGPHLYVIELANYYDHTQQINSIMESKLSILSYIRELAFWEDDTLFSFLNRVKGEEIVERKTGKWYLPHPWLNMFIAKRSVEAFHEVVFNDILRHGIQGTILFYPFPVRNGWSKETSVVIPRGDDVVYAMSLLRFPSTNVEVPRQLVENEKILRACNERNIEYKLYHARHDGMEDWKSHFGDVGWERFIKRKDKYDPKAILASGQNIFKR